MKLVWKLLMAAGVSALALSSCALPGGPIDGVVVDESTGKSVADAIVVVHWHGSWTKIVAESCSACYHAETARTDANGRFHIDKWKQDWSMSDLRFTSNGLGWKAYKPGYWRGEAGAPRPDTLYIAPFKGTKAEYFEKVLASPSWNCERQGESSKNKYRLFKAMADEAAALAETAAERGLSQMLAERANEWLVNREKPTGYEGERDRLRSLDPKDAFKKEEVPL